MSVIASICIRLNVSAQNKYKSDPNTFTNFIQSITYIGSVIVGLPAIFFVGISAIDHLHDSTINTVSFIAGSIFPIVLAFRFGFIPDDKTRKGRKAQ